MCTIPSDPGLLQPAIETKLSHAIFFLPFLYTPGLLFFFFKENGSRFDEVFFFVKEHLFLLVVKNFVRLGKYFVKNRSTVGMDFVNRQGSFF